MLHATGEVTMQGDEDFVFIKPVSIHPVIAIIGEGETTEEQKDRVKMMALHQLVAVALQKVLPKGVTVTSSNPVNMTPTEGEKN